MCDDPAGIISYFLPIYKNGIVEITWEVVDHDAIHYYLERRNAPAEKFERIPGAKFVPDITKNTSTYVYIDTEGTSGSIYRLMEEDIHGNVYVQDIEQAMVPIDSRRDKGVASENIVPLGKKTQPTTKFFDDQTLLEHFSRILNENIAESHTSRRLTGHVIYKLLMRSVHTCR